MACVWAEIEHRGVDPLSKKLEEDCKFPTRLGVFAMRSSCHDGASNGNRSIAFDSAKQPEGPKQRDRTAADEGRSALSGRRPSL
jgi:hypothetical protein